MHILNKFLDELDEENKVSSEFSLIWKNLSSPPNSPFQRNVTSVTALRGPLKIDGTKWKDFLLLNPMHFISRNKFITPEP